MLRLYRYKKFSIPDFLVDEAGFSGPNLSHPKKKRRGLLSKIGMAFAVNEGMDYLTQDKMPKFQVGDYVRVKYRGQEGYIIDMNGDVYMVSLADGHYVDSYYENQLERAPRKNSDISSSVPVLLSHYST